MKVFDEFVEVIATLRGPNGCPWDKEQTFESLRPHLIEECYELAESLDGQTPADIQEELGDVLLQVVMLSLLAKEKAWFDIDAVILGIKEKMIRRHPHVFGDIKAKTVDDVWKNWERIKKNEKKTDSPFQSIPNSLPALMHATKVQKKAVRLDSKITPPLSQEIAKLTAKDIGPTLFALVKKCQELGVEPEAALKQTTRSFINEVEKKLSV